MKLTISVHHFFEQYLPRIKGYGPNTIKAYRDAFSLFLPFARDTLGILADSFVDPFAHITIREHELLGASGNTLDYFAVKGTTAIDFRADNDTNLESLEKNSIDLYASFKSLYLQDRENKINNSTDNEDDWGNLDK